MVLAMTGLDLTHGEMSSIRIVDRDHCLSGIVLCTSIFQSLFSVVLPSTLGNLSVHSWHTDSVQVFSRTKDDMKMAGSAS